MEIAIIGLGRMGSNMARRLLRAGHRCIVYDRSTERRDELKKEGAVPIEHLDQIGEKGEKSVFTDSPRVVWIMLPSGDATEGTVRRLSVLLEANDILIDGGNSFFKDDIRRAADLQQKKIRYLDVGTSGGVWGIERGYCLMIGGDASAARHVDPILRTLAPGAGAAPVSENRSAPKSSTADQGYLYCGPSGAGHFVKMIHNGIEYALMQAYAEGFEILKKANSPSLPVGQHYKLDLREISEVWRRGSVIGSWLLDLIALSLNRDEELSSFEGVVQDSGEGRWTLEAAIQEAVPAHTIAAALFVRFRSREGHSFSERLLSAMRNEFGGHVEPPRGEAEEKAS